jgi:hypothetical protein
MYTYIKKLQSKSEDTRKRILTGSLIVCMSFVVFVWVSSLSSRFHKVENVASGEEVIKPFALFKQSFSGTIDNITASAGNIKATKKVEGVKEEKQIDLIVVDPQ